MNGSSGYRHGVPCWIETLQPDPRAAAAFYNALFGWDAVGPGPMPDGGEYFVARLHGDDVAGIATLPSSNIAEPAWTTYVHVDRLEDTVQRVIAAGGRVVVPPVDAQPAGRLAIVEAPTGATFGLWEPRDRTGAQRINQPSAWAMSALVTRDLVAATPFYTAVFDWQAMPFEAGGAKGVLFRLPGYVGGLPDQPVPRDVVAAALEDKSTGVEHWSVDFWIDDVETAVQRVAASGGTVLQPPFDAMAFRRAVIADPAGVVSSISQLVPERLTAA